MHSHVSPNNGWIYVTLVKEIHAFYVTRWETTLARNNNRMAAPASANGVDLATLDQLIEQRQKRTTLDFDVHLIQIRGMWDHALGDWYSVVSSSFPRYSNFLMFTTAEFFCTVFNVPLTITVRLSYTSSNQNIPSSSTCSRDAIFTYQQDWEVVHGGGWKAGQAGHGSVAVKCEWLVEMGLPTQDLGSAFWLALAGVLSAMLGVMLQYCYKSKCKSFQICCLKIEIDTTAEVQEDIEQMHTAKKPDE